MKSTVAIAGFLVMAGIAMASGCTTGNARLAAMSSAEVREAFKIGSSRMEDVRTILGEPQSTGVQTIKSPEQTGVGKATIVWYYWYQKLRWTAVPPLFIFDSQAITNGRLILGFGESNIVEHVDFYGNK